MNKTTEALKLAEEACKAGIETGKIIAVYAAKTGNDDLAMQFLGDSKFDRALAAIREALADHSGDANEMVIDWSKVKSEAINSDPMYQMGYAAAMSKFAAQFQAEPVKHEVHQEPVAIKFPEPKFEEVAPGVEVGYDIFGGVDIRLGGEFVYVHINYDWRYTHNAARRDLANKIVGLLTSAPVDAKAIRAEAYQQGRDEMKEEAAAMGEESIRIWGDQDGRMVEVVAAIRRLK